MKVICDNCGAMYKIPDEKLVKPVNKATCRQCGHRMLIPRPRRGADPDERTLVTAVPPTPPPAPVRADSGPPTTPIHEVEEKTAPTGSRRTEETRWVRNEVPAPPPTARPQVQVGGAATAHAQRPQPTPQAKRRNAFDDVDEVATQVGPDPTLTYTPRDETPEPRPAPPPAPRRTPRAAELDDHIEEDEVEDTPPPKAKKKKKKKKAAAPAHDPRGDMGLALFGVMVALLGVTILGVTSVLDASIQDVGAYAAVLGSAAIGLMLAVGGGVGAFLVLLTSGRGSKPAWRVASILVAILLALLIGGVPAAGRAVYDVVLTGVDAASSFGDLMARTELPEAPPVAPPEALAGAEDPPEDDGAAAAVTDTDTTEEAEDTDAGTTEEDGAADEDAGGEESSTSSSSGSNSGTTSGRSSSGRSSSGRSSSGRSSSGRSSSGRSSSGGSSTGGSSSSDDLIDDEPEFTDDEELDLPDDLDLGGGSGGSSSAKSNLPASPPLTAIDVMVKSNTGVKRCFFEYQKAEGKLPKRVDVKFTIKPNGDATSISTTQNKLSGTELESCLIRSIRSITFPPSQKGTTLTFPFVFG